MTRSGINRSPAAQSKELVSWPYIGEEKPVASNTHNCSAVARSNWSRFLAGTPLAVPAQLNRR